ncbi:MAG: hypothetical protein K2L00_08980, partial [Muribaculaceae bacterium]|nr:hypothetical protein [Muribaculaceae bacterium]
KAFFDYYSDSNMAVTVTVVRTEGLQRLARAAKEIYAYGSKPANSYGLMNYSRLRTGLYDFGQFSKKWLDSPSMKSDPEAQRLLTEFDSALADMTVFAGCSTKNFNGTEGAFVPEEYSGFSCYFPGSADSATETYYSTLDWPTEVY